MTLTKVFRAGLAVAALLLASQQTQAAFIVGSTNFNFVGPDTVPNVQNLDNATGFAFPNGFLAGADRFGNYNTQLATNAPGTASALNFTSSSIGAVLTGNFMLDFNPGGSTKTFTATSGSIIARTFTPSGTFNATLFGLVNFTGFDPTPGIVTISFTQTAGQPNAISGSGSLASPFGGTPPVAPVPVPATLVLASIGGIVLAGARLLRRQIV